MTSPETILELAHAVTSDSNALMIDGNNNPAGYRALDEAAKSGVAFAVDVRSDILAIDFDFDEIPKLRPALEQLAAELVGSGIQPVRVASGREGHEHVFAVVGPDRDAWIRRAETLGLPRNCVRRKIRPPLSPHRSGVLQPSLVAPKSPALALQFLQPNYVPSDPIWVRRLRDGMSKGKRSESIPRFILHALNAGASVPAIWRSLTDPRNKLGDKLREKGEQGAAKWFLGALEIASKRFRENPPIRDKGAAFEALSAFRLKIDDAFLPGRAGARKKAVLSVLTAEGFRRGSIKVAVSQRSLAEETGLSPCRARETVTELEGTWFRVDRSKKPTVYVLYDACCVSVPNTPYTPPIEDMVDVGTVAQQNHDVFRGRSGLIRWRIYETLGRGPARASALAAHLGVHRSTVCRHLREMATVGLALLAEEWQMGPASLDEAAARLGTAGRQEKQRERHASERKKFAKWKRKPMGRVIPFPLPRPPEDMSDVGS